MGNDSSKLSRQLSLRRQIQSRCVIEHEEEEETFLPPADLKKKTFLLLGAGESGKYTMYKQLKKLLKGSEYSTEEKQLYRSIIQENIYKITYKFLRWCKKQNLDIGKLGEGKIANMDSETILNLEYYTLYPEFVKELFEIWENEIFLDLFLTYQNEIDVFEGMNFFKDNLKRIMNLNYIPTFHDILCSRIKTTGLVDSEYHVRNEIIKIILTGGQRCERQKWQYVVDDANMAINLVNLCHYHRRCYEDDHTNRLVEDLNVYQQVVNLYKDTEVPIALLFNKADFLPECLEKHPLKHFGWEDFQYGNDTKRSIKYITQKFLNIHSENIFPHVLSTFNEDEVQAVYRCLNNILNQKAEGKECCCTCAHRLNLFDDQFKIKKSTFEYLTDVEIKFCS
eukprot:gene4624-8197_t